MPDSMAEMLRQDMQCEGLLECLHGLKSLDERSTAYRSIQRLLQTGLVSKEQVNYEQGGYYHVYYPSDPDEVADDMQRLLNDWYAQIGNLIGEFREKYAEEATPAPTPEQ